MKKNQDVIGRRIESTFKALVQKDYEQALINLFPAMDNTARARRPNAKVGERIKLFISDEEVLISGLALRKIFKGVKFGEYTLPEAIYKMARNPMVHNGELDKRMEFVEQGMLLIGEKWIMPQSFIWAMMISVITAPENSSEFLLGKATFTLYGQQFNVSELWGDKSKIFEKFPPIGQAYP